MPSYTEQKKNLDVQTDHESSSKHTTLALKKKITNGIQVTTTIKKQIKDPNAGE